MTMEVLHQVFDGARGVVVHEERGLVSVWNGSATVNVYFEDGLSLALVSMWMCDGMDFEEFRRLANEHVEVTDDE